MTSGRIELTTNQVAQRLGIGRNAVIDLARQGYLTNLKAEPGKRRNGAFAASDVRFLQRFYEKKGKDWKKAYPAARANPDAPVPVAPAHKFKKAAAKVRAALDAA